MFELMDTYSQNAVIKVLGVGGGGGNAVSHMVQAGLEGVDFICINTDAQALKHSKVRTALQIGCNITKGLGAGATLLRASRTPRASGRPEPLRLGGRICPGVEDELRRGGVGPLDHERGMHRRAFALLCMTHSALPSAGGCGCSPRNSPSRQDCAPRRFAARRPSALWPAVREARSTRTNPPELLGANEAAGLEHVEVLNDCGERHRERACEFAHGRGPRVRRSTIARRLESARA